MNRTTSRTTENSEAAEAGEGTEAEAATMVGKEFRKTKKPSRSESEVEVEELTEVEDVQACQLNSCNTLLANSKTNTNITTSPNTGHQSEAAARLPTSSIFRQEEEAPPDTWASVA